VVVSVKTPEHYRLAKPALEAKKDVFVEWPLGANLKQAEELTGLAKAQGVKNIIGLQARQEPTILKAKEMVAAGKLGDILGTTVRVNSHASGSDRSEPLWRQT
jgi:predicted dehydrogenase